VILALVTSLSLAGALTADAAGQWYYPTGSTYYRFWYNNSTELNLAKQIQTYLTEARRSALVSTAGKQSMTGYINVYFYYAKSTQFGYFNYSPTSTYVYLNRYQNLTAAKWGGHLAYYTSKIFFYSYTNANYWACVVTMYREFISESLALYAQNMVYANGSRYTKTYVQTQLKSAKKAAGGQDLSWYGSWYEYKIGTKKTQGMWQLYAQGHYFTGGNTINYYSRLATLMNTFRYYAKSGGPLRTITSKTFTYVEASFKAGWGYPANSTWYYTGSNNGAYKNRDYLYGQWWYLWLS
jgi:hypothetical protein